MTKEVQPALGARCPNCNRLGPGEDAQEPCPSCSHSPQDAAFIAAVDCRGGEVCAYPVFHHPSGARFWVFDGWKAPGIRA